MTTNVSKLDATHVYAVTKNRDKKNRAIVTALDRLLSSLSVDDLLKFLSDLDIKFSLATEGGDNQRKKFFYRCKIFKQCIEENGNQRTIFCYSSSGKMPQLALRNAIAEFVVCENSDFHDYLNFNKG